MTGTARHRVLSRTVVLDRSLEGFPLFRLGDSTDEAAIEYSPQGGGRWRALPAPGDRLPGTFDQDVYVELLRRYHEAGAPADGTLSFTLHAFLRSMGRRVDGRTYEQLRSALTRLWRTILVSEQAYYDRASGGVISASFSVLAAVQIDRRRQVERDQLGLFPALTNNEPGDARVTIAAAIRSNIAAGHAVSISATRYFALSSPVARRIYRLLELARLEGHTTWQVSLDRLAGQLPLVQRFPSHLQRVLQPAHEMLVAAGVLRGAAIVQGDDGWMVDYSLAPKLG